MSTVEYTSATKSALRAMLEVEARRSGSRTLAYEKVAKTIGASSSWIRKYLTYDDRVAEPRVSLFQSISKAYDIICSRVELERDIERAKLNAIRDEINAVNQGFVRLVDRTSETKAR